MTRQIEDIKLTELLTTQIASLYLSGHCSDIILDVKGHKIPAHRSIIGARCEYLNNFMASGLNKPNQNIFELNVLLKPFKILLEYFYTGQIPLTKINDVELLIQILSLIEEYCLFYLKPHFENYFNEILSVENACQLLDAAKIYELKELETKSLNLIDRNSEKILATESFQKISKTLLEEILSRDLFIVSSELCLFNAVNEWSKHENRNIETVIHVVNLSAMTAKELLIIRNSSTLNLEKMFDTIEKQIVEKSGPTPSMFEHFPQLLTSYDDTKCYTPQTISRINNSSIIVKLGGIFILNHLKLFLLDCDDRMYSYFIESSTNDKKWERIIDYSAYDCSSWQNLYFPAKPIKYIKIVGTDCSKNNYLDIMSLKAYYRESIPEIKDGLVVPKNNVALVHMMGATVVEADDWDWDKNCLINGDPMNGWTSHKIEKGRCILIRLSQPYYIGSMRMLLDSIPRSTMYKFYVETSLNNKDWKEVGNKRNEFVTSWQSFHFPVKPVLFIRIVGTESYSSDIQNFYVYHFECPSQVDE